MSGQTDSDWDSGYEAGVRAGAAEAEDTRVSYDRYREIMSYDPGEATRLLQQGGVNMEDHPTGRAVWRAIQERRADDAKRLGPVSTQQVGFQPQQEYVGPPQGHGFTFADVERAQAAGMSLPEWVAAGRQSPGGDDDE